MNVDKYEYKLISCKSYDNDNNTQRIEIVKTNIKSGAYTVNIDEIAEKLFSRI